VIEIACKESLPFWSFDDQAEEAAKFYALIFQAYELA